MKKWVAHISILAIVVIFSQRVSALPISASVNIGKPLVFVDLDEVTRKELGAPMALSTDINLFLPDYPFAVGVYYEVFLMSKDFGTLPINNAGPQVSYYPFGKPIYIQNQSGEINITNLGLSVYGTLGSGLTFMNIRDTSNVFIFGAAAFNFRLSTTLEYPISNQFSLGGSVLYQTTFGGKSPIDPEPTVGLTGWSLMTRFIITLN